MASPAKSNEFSDFVVNAAVASSLPYGSRLEHVREVGRAATVLAVAPVPGWEPHKMKAKASKASDEPVGIVIAGKPAVLTVSVFSAYVWGPAPGTADDDQKTS